MMLDSILKAVRSARASYEYALLKSDDKARNGHASGALTDNDLATIRAAAWEQVPGTPLAFWPPPESTDQLTVVDQPPDEAQTQPAPEARAVAEGEDLT